MSGADRGRAAIVTGAASGIGRASVELLLAEGVAVVAVDRPQTDRWTDDAARVVWVEGDVCDAAVNAAAAAIALERFGGIDVLVCCAGIPMSGDLLTLPMEQLDRVLDVNVRAVVLAMRVVVPAMRVAGAGSIVVIASTSGLGGDPGMWPYNTSKGAVVNLVRAAALDLGPDAIRVNAVCPGPTETGMTAAIKADPARYEALRRRIPLQRWGSAHDVAAVVGFLASPAAAFVTGAAIPVDGGITASTGQFLPRERRA